MSHKWKKKNWTATNTKKSWKKLLQLPEANTTEREKLSCEREHWIRLSTFTLCEQKQQQQEKI